MSFDVPATPVEIAKVGHSALRNGTRSVPQELFGTPALHELIEVMRATLAGSGVGLAAPQIAVPLRLFIVEDTQERMGHLTPVDVTSHLPRDAGSRAIVLRSGTSRLAPMLPLRSGISSGWSSFAAPGRKGL
jgi:hypothetical protein